jgi:hypothetical protein
VDDITQQTPCALQSKHKGIIFTVGHGTVAPTQPGDVYHGQPIPVGYAKVGVEELCQDFETLELDIPGGDGETTLAQAIHGWILWEKRNILLKSTDQASRLASPQPPPRACSMSPPSPLRAPQHSPSRAPIMSPRSPASSPGQQASPLPPPPRQQSPPSPPPPPAKQQKQPPRKQSSIKEPPKKKEQMKKNAKEPAKLPGRKLMRNAVRKLRKRLASTSN